MATAKCKVKLYLRSVTFLCYEKDQVSDLKEMCDVLKKEKAEVEKKLSHLRGVCNRNSNSKSSQLTISPLQIIYFALIQSGRSGKTIPELEKTIGLMKKVVEKVQRENETLKKAPAANLQEQLTTLEKDHEKLKVCFVKTYIFCIKCCLYIFGYSTTL